MTADDCQLSWREASLLNARNLVQIAAWEYSLEKIDELFSDEAIEEIFRSEIANLSIERPREHYLSVLAGRMNNELTRITMSVLCQSALEIEGRNTYAQRARTNN
jgi:hypothetical protein